MLLHINPVRIPLQVMLLLFYCILTLYVYHTGSDIVMLQYITLYVYHTGPDILMLLHINPVRLPYRSWYSYVTAY